MGRGIHNRFLAIKYDVLALVVLIIMVIVQNVFTKRGTSEGVELNKSLEMFKIKEVLSTYLVSFTQVIQHIKIIASIKYEIDTYFEFAEKTNGKPNIAKSRKNKSKKIIHLYIS